MGILNITPDSFADGGVRMDPDRAAADAVQMVADGADILDIGGESTRPGAPAVPADEEWRRIAPVLERLRGRVSVPISIDTYKAEVAAKALAAGATIVNDVSGLTFDPDLASVVARHGAAIVLMHTRGRSDDMYARAQYDDVVRDVIRELGERGAAARAAGIDEARVIYDPGIGFAKRAEQSFEVLARFAEFAALGRPLLAGPSRKSFLKTALAVAPPDLTASAEATAVRRSISRRRKVRRSDERGRSEEPWPPATRVWGTAAAVTAAVLAGAHIVRVHDVAEMTQVVRVADAIRGRA
jgi:dihydropteroate synthase